MISKDSEIIDFKEQNFNHNSEEVFELIHTTSHSLLYRMRRDGKYFIVKQSVLSEENGRKILRREYEIARGISHPNIVDVYEYRFSDDYQDSIIMEYVEGRTLNDFLTESPPFKTKKRIFSELLDAIEYLHRQRIIHNDIKPENIIVSSTGDRVKLIDLGLSDDDANYAIKTPGFTKGFSAPELLEKGKSDIRSDIYSLGVIAKLLFGNRYKVISGKCVRHNPNKRFQTTAEVRRQWSRFYWRWLIPLICLSVLFISFAIVILIKEWQTQSREREVLKNEISQQNLELIEQKESFGDLKNNYEFLQDSLKVAKQIAMEHENKKNSMINNFINQLTNYSNSTIDSLNKSDHYFEMSSRRLNYKNKVRSFYKSYPKIVDNEDITIELKNIMEEEFEKVDKEFDNILQTP